VKTATIARVTVLTSSKGLTLYSFAPDTPTTSKCITGTFGTIKRSDGST
jgi:predicted lipoprotein with Yx(FWY)xxD motif